MSLFKEVSELVVTVPDEEYNRRMSICQSCEHIRPIKVINSSLCGVCNCVVNAKCKFKQSSCPHGKW